MFGFCMRCSPGIVVRETCQLERMAEARRAPGSLIRWFLCCSFVALPVVAVPGYAQRAPSRPDEPWTPPSSNAQAQSTALGRDPHTSVDGEHVYTLPELVDLAEQHNPATRAAWEQARGQAELLGIARSDLYPAMTAVMMTNTTRDGVLFGSTWVRQTIGFYQPMLEVNYLILDFGARSSRIATAREQLLSANFSFNRVQLDVLFEVSRRYYRLLNTIGQRDAAQVNFENADTVRKAVEARLKVGLSTLPDALEARAASLQANYALQDAIGQVDIARGDLLSLLGASPLSRLTVQSLDQLTLPDRFEVDPAVEVKRAMVQRPELGEQTAALAAARQELRQAHSAFLPQLQFQGQGGENRAFGQQNQLPSTYAGPFEEWNVNLSLQWDVFDGGRRVEQLERAHDDEKRAQANIDDARDQIEQQVWSAYVSLRTAFAQRDAATALLSASQTSYDAALKTYQLGLRNIVDVVSAQRTLAEARSGDVTARTELLNQLANLAYRTGDLLQSTARKSHP